RRAGSGTHGEGDLRHGRSGEDVVVPVPLGTVARFDDGRVLADLVHHGQRVVAVTGGRAGRGNAGLVTPRLRSPGFSEQGEYGEEVTLRLEVKLIADAALIGFPNAGKSTFISAVSAARPKVADYPFTTLQPHLGVVELDDRQFVLADIPGLIEGAAEGKGLGQAFLRHAERARVLVIMLDPSSLQTVDAMEQHSVLVDELAKHSSDLSARPGLVVVSKTDLDEVGEQLPELEEAAAAAGIQLYPVSGVTGDGVKPLLSAILEAVAVDRREAPDRPGYVLHRPVDGGFAVVRDGDTWVLSGRAAERAVNLDDLASSQALDLVASRLAGAGIIRALEEAGAVTGDDVRIGELLFEFYPVQDESEDEIE
ncbi:MAG: Obg family GTPase CgtA, partial [Acidimicrobiia bacterium]